MISTGGYRNGFVAWRIRVYELGSGTDRSERGDGGIFYTAHEDSNNPAFCCRSLRRRSKALRTYALPT
jgi:hypothetical protein